MNQPLRIAIDHVMADDRHCAELCKQLAPLVQQNRIAMWSGLSIGPGSDRAAERRQNLERAEVVLLLISAEYLASESCLNLAQGDLLDRQRRGATSVVPVIVKPATAWHQMPFGHLSPLPPDGRPVTSRRQPDQGWGEVVAGLQQLLAQQPAGSTDVPVPVPHLSTLRSDPAVRLPLFDPLAWVISPRSSYEPGWYVPRPDFEAQVIAALSWPRAAVVIKAPDLVGKSWLLWHLVARLHGSAKVAHLDLSVLPQERTATKAVFLSEVASALLSAAKPEADAGLVVGQAFTRPGGPEACLRYVLDHHALPALQHGQGLVLVLDSLDVLIDKSYQNDVLGLLRGLLQALPGSPRDALRLLMAISTGRALYGHNIYQSTLLNISEMKQLPHFAPNELALLCERFGLQTDEAAPLHALVGGHPYLLHLGLHEARRRGQTLAGVIGSAPEIFSDYLESRRRRLRQQPGLYEALRGIAQGSQEPVSFDMRCRLLDAGFIDHKPGGTLQLRCPLYELL